MSNLYTRNCRINMVTVIFEAHATSFDNEAKIASGHFDAQLSPLGEKQAKELGERYQDTQIDAIFCSDMQRAYRAAEIAFAGRGIPIFKDERLRECDYGEFTRRSSVEVEHEKVKHIIKPFPGGESYEEAALRMKEFLQDLLKEYNGKKVIIIGHRATQYGLEHWINGVPLKEVVTAPWSWQPGWTYYLEK